MRQFALAQGGLIVSTVLIGVVMNHMNIPAFVQPLHLWLASLIFGVQITVYFFLRYGTRRGAAGNHSNHSETRGPGYQILVASRKCDRRRLNTGLTTGNSNAMAGLYTGSVLNLE